MGNDRDSDRDSGGSFLLSSIGQRCLVSAVKQQHLGERRGCCSWLVLSSHVHVGCFFVFFFNILQSFHVVWQWMSLVSHAVCKRNICARCLFIV